MYGDGRRTWMTAAANPVRDASVVNADAATAAVEAAN